MYLPSWVWINQLNPRTSSCHTLRTHDIVCLRCRTCSRYRRSISARYHDRSRIYRNAVIPRTPKYWNISSSYSRSRSSLDIFAGRSSAIVIDLWMLMKSGTAIKIPFCSPPKRRKRKRRETHAENAYQFLGFRSARSINDPAICTVHIQQVRNSRLVKRVLSETVESEVKQSGSAS